MSGKINIVSTAVMKMTVRVQLYINGALMNGMVMYIHTWKKYLTLTGKVDHIIDDHVNHICRTHYRRLFEIKQLRACSVCNSHDSSSCVI